MSVKPRVPGSHLKNGQLLCSGLLEPLPKLPSLGSDFLSLHWHTRVRPSSGTCLQVLELLLRL